MTTQQEFFQAHQVDGQLTDEQMAEMLHLPEGDTGEQPESGQPDPATATTDDAAEVEKAAKKAGEEPATAATPADGGKPNETDTPVVLARDGKHTIPYEKLVEARNGEQQWKAKAEEAQQQLEALRAQAEQRADAGAKPTATDKAVAQATAAIDGGVDPAIFGDFSEADLAKGIQTLVRMGVEQATAALRSELEPLKAKQTLTDEQIHFQTIYEAHPDADSVHESAELAGWIAKQPSVARDAYQAVLQQGTAAQVIELFDAFKAATAKAPAASADNGVAAAAKAAIARAESRPPTSLSEIPAGSAAHHDEASAMLEMSSTSLMSKFDGKSPEQIAEMLSKVL